MRTGAVTTFNLSGFDLYGRKMIEMFHNHWCCNVTLKVYSEGWIPEQYYPEVEYRDLLSNSEWLNDFRQRNKGRNKPNNYRYDAIRFSHKVAALLAAAKDRSLDYLIWLDGDIITHEDVDSQIVESFFPSTKELIAWLDRSKMYPETGFFILNCRHPRYEEFLERYRNIYVSDGLFKLQEWHDAFVIEHVIRKEMSVRIKSLSGDGYHTTHPLVHGPLGQWFDHAKGVRKVKGRTPKSEVRRDEPYWKL